MTMLTRGRLIAAATALSLVAMPSVATAGTQGALAATSTGTVNISATVPNRVQITGLADVTFTNADPTVAATNAQNVCVWSNTSTKGYNIKATGDGASSAFTLASGTLPVVPYSVQWNQTVGASTGTALTTNTALAGQKSTATTPTCASGTESASLVITIAAADLQSMTSSTTYAGTLTLLVAPE